MNSPTPEQSAILDSFHSPTSEQEAIIKFAEEKPDNLLVNALAGTGKTSTIEMICQSLKGIPILYLAFNRRIVDEAVKRMPGHVECRTQNALGHRVWQQAVGRRLIVESDKMRKIVRALIGELPRREQDDAWEEYSDTIALLTRVKRDGVVPPAWVGRSRPTCDWFDWFESLDDTPSPQQRRLANEAMRRSIAAAYEGNIDYDDQIYMPVIFGGPWPRFPLVVADEVQDFNPLQHIMLERLVTKRLIAVGDPWQSIYAFRGAVFNGMRLLRDKFEMAELPLSVTFRVPKRGVERARSRVESYVAYEANPDGEIIELDSWNASSIPTEAAIICRNNAPLLSLGFKLLRQGRAIKLVGFDIGAGLIRIMTKLGPVTLNPTDMFFAIERWTKSQLLSAKRSETVYDRAECLRALCGNAQTLGDAITNAKDIFKREGPIQLLSGHKAKGLEWDNVFHLDPWRIPSRFAMTGTEAWEQEMNVKYVIETRFKRTLYIANLEDFDGS